MRRAAFVGAWLILAINLALLGKGLGGFLEKSSHPADRSIRLLTLNVQFTVSVFWLTVAVRAPK